MDADGQNSELVTVRRTPGLARLVLRSLGLTILTLGFYRFWARTAWRRHVWNDIVLRGDALEYTGTGIELLKRFVIAIAAVIPIFALLSVLKGFGDAGTGLADVVILVNYIVIAGLIAVAKYGTRRYRLSRTNWRGVALKLDAPLKEYLVFWIGVQARNAATLFLFAPQARLALETWLWSRTRVGTAGFVCMPPRVAAMKPYLVAYGAAALLLLSLIEILAAYFTVLSPFAALLHPVSRVLLNGWMLIGLPLVWTGAYIVYRIEMFRTVVGHLSLNGARFTSAARPQPVLGIILSGLAGTYTLTFLAAIPITWNYGSVWSNVFATPLFLLFYAFLRDLWIAPRCIRHIAASISIAGGEALDAIHADVGADRKSGEGLSEMFDVGPG